MSAIFKSCMRNFFFVKIVTNMSRNMLRTTERTVIIKLHGNNTGCMPVLLEKG